MKTAIQIALSGATALIVWGCSTQSTQESKSAGETVWEVNIDGLARLGLLTGLSQSGSQIEVRVSNGSREPLCIARSSWPGEAVGLDHFKVLRGNAIVPYSGYLNSMLSDDELALSPGETWTLKLDLSPYYATNWREARVSSFWAPFYSCASAS